MAEIDLEKKTRNSWIWVLVVLILALALFWAWTRTRNDDVAQFPSRSSAEVAVAALPASEPVPAMFR
jgi:hypothetical protein